MSQIGIDFSQVRKQDLDLIAEFFEELICNSKKKHKSTKKEPP